MEVPFMKNRSMTLILAAVLLILAAASLFAGVIDVSLTSLLSGDAEQWRIFLISRAIRM